MIFEIITLAGFLCVVVGVLYMTVVRPRLIAAERSGPRPMDAPWGGYGAQSYAGQQPYPGQAAYGQPGSPWSGQAPPPPAPGWAPPSTTQPGATSPGASEPSGQTTSPESGGPPLYPPTAQAPPPYVAPPPTEAPPFGWYADPSGRHELRYWDGTRWTEYVSDGGTQSTEPLPF